LQIKTKIVSCHTADSKPVKQEVNGTVILPPLVFPGERKRMTLVEWKAVRESVKEKDKMRKRERCRKRETED
jgi:hypothetical protein